MIEIERRSGEDRRHDLKNQIKELRNIIFNMLNFTNMYVLVLDDKMNVKFANTSLAIDLGFNEYKEILGRCWLDFIEDDDHKKISVIHRSISTKAPDWEDHYKEVTNAIKGKDGNIDVCWFNSYINSNYHYTFSFGIRRKPIELPKNEKITMDNVRDYYHDIINKDRVMINSIKDMIGLEDKIIDSCKPNLVGEFNGENSIFV